MMDLLSVGWMVEMMDNMLDSLTVETMVAEMVEMMAGMLDLLLVEMSADLMVVMMDVHWVALTASYLAASSVAKMVFPSVDTLTGTKG